MQDEKWTHPSSVEGHEVIEEFELNAGGLVGAVASIEGTGHLVTGTRNDEIALLLDGRVGINAARGPPVGNRLTVHSIRDTQGRVLGLGSQQQQQRDDGQEADAQAGGGGRGWEPVVEAWVVHEGGVTGMDVVGGYGNPGGVSSSFVTSGGDGSLRLFELTLGDNNDDEVGSSIAPKGQLSVHANDRATGVAAARGRAVTVGEDGAVRLVDLQRLDGVGGGGDGGGVIWGREATGALPLSGVTFQGESEEVFATSGCDPRGQLMVWDARAKGDSPACAVFGGVNGANGSEAPYLCVTSQPFNPEVFACGVSTGEILLWDVRAGVVMRELQVQDEIPRGGTWGVAFHPRRPRNVFSCTGTGTLMKWELPPDGRAAPAFGTSSNNNNNNSGDWQWIGGRHLHGLPSRSGLVGVCYDEEADTVSAVSKHGIVVVAHAVEGLRL